MKIVVCDLVEGEDAITIEAGTRVFDAIHARLAGGDQVILDFAEVTTFASPFFNAAVGRLLADLSPTELNARLSVINIAPVGQCVLRRVIENAKRFYAEPNYREAQAKLLASISGEG